MNILHTEASTGWGGQEIRILREAIGMRQRGHEIFFITEPGAMLAKKAREMDFVVKEIPFKWKSLLLSLPALIFFLKKHCIDIVNTHSSLDGWIGGIAAKIAQKKVIRTRHISAQIKGGLNARILYGYLSDYTVTTCKEVANKIQFLAKIPKERCRSIPTGIDLSLSAKHEKSHWGYSDRDFVVGTACILRSWKGVSDLIEGVRIAAKEIPELRLLIVGSGPCEKLYRKEAEALGKRVQFTGYLDNPLPAIASMDVFSLLSTSNEGVSQASLQAAALKRPLITTPVGGLKEICRHEETGLLVPRNSSQRVAEAIVRLAKNPEERSKMGEKAQKKVTEEFTFNRTLDEMESVYCYIQPA